MVDDHIKAQPVQRLFGVDEVEAEVQRRRAEAQIDRIVERAYAERDREHGDPIKSLVRLAVRLALSDGEERS